MNAMTSRQPQSEQQSITVIGAGLAGCEAAWQLAERGVFVRLYEMRPHQMTPAHKTGGFAELVCSNSLRAASVENAVGLVKEEMRCLDSLIMRAADATKVPAGAALAVDRTLFSQTIEQVLSQHPKIEIMREEVTQIPEGTVIVAAGPLVSDALSQEIVYLTGQTHLFFHDAIAPVVSSDSIDFSKAFFASRYDKGEPSEREGDYINCPMDREQYLDFYRAIVDAERYPLKNFETPKTFEGCMPIETMAERGVDTMRYGPLKPVGLTCPDGTEPYAVVQLRQDDAAATMYNLVGFQTRLRQGEQERVFRLIPGLEHAEFLRFGQMHRNTYLDSPKLLNSNLSLKTAPRIFFAGQITGVEGYVESAACGLAAAIYAAAQLQQKSIASFPQNTALGSLIRYITTPNAKFQPMNITFGIMPPLQERIKNKKEKNAQLARRALEGLKEWLNGSAVE